MNQDKSFNLLESACDAIASCNYSSIKPSLSLTNLPPKEHQDGKEIIKAKLRKERPYNSLKKKRNSDVDRSRHSWSSTHSSCSIYSSANGITFGKDDFWAALQTNYDYIMDTNLLDTCKEARHEIEGAAGIIKDSPECCEKRYLQSSRSENYFKNPKILRKWLKKMEKRLSRVPSLSQATQLTIEELEKNLTEHSVLYCEIVSHARVVGACIRASEKVKNNDTEKRKKKYLSNYNLCDRNMKELERRYHLLYLRAIEVQCLFEGLLRKKNSPTTKSSEITSDPSAETASGEKHEQKNSFANENSIDIDEYKVNEVFYPNSTDLCIKKIDNNQFNQKEVEIKKEYSYESIKQLVLNAENLVRDEIKKIPSIRNLKEWLEHQPKNIDSTSTTDCEASEENTESNSDDDRESDTSQNFTDSGATYMQTESISQYTSNEMIDGSTEPIHNNAIIDSNQISPCISDKVIRRENRQNSNRPWSVSCLSQLSENKTIKSSTDKINKSQELKCHSASETALHIISLPRRIKNLSQTSSIRNLDDKVFSRKRKIRKRKIIGKKSNSGSDNLLPYELPKLAKSAVVKSESIKGQINIIQDLTMTLEMISVSNSKKLREKPASDPESEEDEQTLQKPNFKLGSYTSTYVPNKSKLGSLAALSNYRNEEQGEYHTGTEDHSSFSEQAWDNYQEKYNSENYSEGFDSDAARKLLEFGDDYRNFLDSQSDCCSSLSAANNIDSLSSQQMDFFKLQEDTKFPQPIVVNITNRVDHMKRRRTLEMQYERRKKSSETRKKPQDIYCRQSLNTSSTTIHPLSESNKNFCDSSNDDTQVMMNCFSTFLRKPLEKDTSQFRRKSDDSFNSRRTSIKTEKYKSFSPSSSTCNDESDEGELKSLLQQIRNRLENTQALKSKSHLLQPEDFAEIFSTCHNNIRCLESVFDGLTVTLLSSESKNEIKDLLSSWKNLSYWSENAMAVKKLDQEITDIENVLNRLGRQTCEFDSQSIIQFAVETLKNEKMQLQSYRTSMLRLNASAHSWMTRQDVKSKKEFETLIIKNENFNATNQKKILSNNNIMQSENEFEKYLKDRVSNMYKAWDDANSRINNNLEALTAFLIAWRQLEHGLCEFDQVLGKDRGTLKEIETALDKGQANEVAQNIKLVAKFLSENVDVQQENQAKSEKPAANHFVLLPKFPSSNGSLSDSGISDGGVISDGGLSERERKLSVLRRLAKQLEDALSPDSEALKSIMSRMEAAESELKTLQNACRELLYRTAASQNENLLQELNQNPIELSNTKIKNNCSSSSQKKTKRNSNKTSLFKLKNKKAQGAVQQGIDEIDFSGSKKFTDNSYNNTNHRNRVCKILKFAIPIQIAVLGLLCVSLWMEPRCCDSINNLSMSFTPQLRYICGPPPI